MVFSEHKPGVYTLRQCSHQKRHFTGMIAWFLPSRCQDFQNHVFLCDGGTA